MQRLKIIFKLFIGLALLLYLILNFGWREILTHLVQVDLTLFALCVLLTGLSILIHALRWKRILARRDSDASFWQLVELILIGNFFSLFLPTGIGGDVYRAQKGRGFTGTFMQSAKFIVFERFAGYFGALLMGCVALIFDGFFVRQSTASLVILGATAVFGVCYFLASSQHGVRIAEFLLQLCPWSRLRDFALKTTRALHDLVADTPLFIEALAFSITMKFLAGVIVFYLGISLGFDSLRFVDVIVYIPLMMVLIAVPVSVNGLGVREAGSAFYFIQMGMSGEASASLAFLILIHQYVTTLPGGLFLMRSAREQHGASRIADVL